MLSTDLVHNFTVHLEKIKQNIEGTVNHWAASHVKYLRRAGVSG